MPKKKKGINLADLPEYMSGLEIQELVNFSYDMYRNESLEEMWVRKLRESKVRAGDPEYRPHGAGVYTSLRKHGWSADHNEDCGYDKVRIIHGHDEVRLSDAHHRVAAAAHIERTYGRKVMIPVEHVSY